MKTNKKKFILMILVICFFGLTGCVASVKYIEPTKGETATITAGGWQEEIDVFADPYKCVNRQVLSYMGTLSKKSIKIPANKFTTLFFLYGNAFKSCHFAISFYPLPNQDYILDVSIYRKLCQLHMYRQSKELSNGVIDKTLHPVKFIQRIYVEDYGVFNNKSSCVDNHSYVSD